MRVLLHDGGGGSDRYPERALVAIAPRDTAAGVREMGTSAESAPQTGDVRSVSRLDGPWDVIDGGSDGSRLGEHVVR